VTKFITIRWLIPTAMLVFVGLVLTIAYFSSRAAVKRQVADSATAAVHRQLAALQNIGEQSLRLGTTENLQKLLSGFAAEPEAMQIVATDANGTVIAAHRYALIGKDWHDGLPDIDAKRVDEVLRTRTSLVWPAPGGSMLNGLTPLCPMEVVRHFLRSDHCGVIYYRMALEPRYRMMASGMRLQLIYTSSGVVAAAMGMVLLLRRFITRRVEVLAAAIHHFVDKDKSIRLRLGGHDELAELSRSVNFLFKRIRTADRLLRDEEERLRAIFDTVLEGIVTINARGCVESMNPAAETMFGYTAAEVVGRNVSMLMADEHRQRHDAYLENYRRTGVKKIASVEI
jgi:PAS domain-containing protein